MAEAYAQVKSALGSEAVILHTRSYQQRFWLGIRRREVVEITAGKGINVPDRRKPASRNPVQRREALAYAGAASVGSAKTAATGGTANPRALLETPAAGTAMLMGLQTEMSGLKNMVRDLVSQVRHQQSPQVPEALFDHYMNLIQNRVADELALEIIQTVQRSIRPEHATQADFVREKIAEQVEKLLPTSGAIQKKKTDGPHVVALIGPTGVGKTTTIAKLAANLQLRERQRVGLITIDTYRIAAVDQLKKYAEIIGAPLKVVHSPQELKEAIEAMNFLDFVLIDTAGRSPRDTLKLNELKSFLAAANPDEVHLVLSSTAEQSCVEMAIERFSDVRADKIIFTKLDEAAHVGVMLNVVRKVNKALSYVTTGQDVPDDIEVGKGRELAQMILGKM